MRVMTVKEKVVRAHKVLVVVTFKVVLFGGATAVAMWVWHTYTKVPHPFHEYFLDNTKMALYIEALKALMLETWVEVGEDLTEDVATDAVAAEIVEGGQHTV